MGNPQSPALPPASAGVLARYNAAKLSDGLATYTEAKTVWKGVLDQGGVAPKDMRDAEAVLSGAWLQARKVGLDPEKLTEMMTSLASKLAQGSVSEAQRAAIYQDLVGKILEDANVMAEHPQAANTIMATQGVVAAVMQMREEGKEISPALQKQYDEALAGMTEIGRAMQNFVAASLIMSTLQAKYDKQGTWETAKLAWQKF